MNYKTIIFILVAIIIIALGAYAYKMGGPSERVIDNENQVPTSSDNLPGGNGSNTSLTEFNTRVRNRAASDLGVSESLVTIMKSEPKEWPDACLGLVGLEEMCAQVITPGFEVKVEVQGKLYTYRTNIDGSIVKKD